MTSFTLSRRLLTLSAGAVAAGLTLAPTFASAADDFPSKPIEIVIHSSYGGGTDVTARMVSLRARKELDTDIAIVSKRGGSGSSAQEYVMSKPADGYTLLALTQTHLYTIAQGKSKMGINDMVGVVRAMDDPTFITVGKNSKYKTIDELVAASKTTPLNWGVAQIGGTEHIALARFAKAAGIKFKAVPFGSGGEMIQALLSGDIEATLPNVSEAVTQIEDGSVNALVVLSAKRLAGYPDVPTSVEKGWDVKASTTRGYAVRAGTPQAIIDKLSEKLVKAMKHEMFATYLKGSGLTPEDSVAGTVEWDKQLKAEYVESEAALKELGIIK
ncbi:tripartite tricarboxylate transporter substrate binding protein [Alphaproteobacteria bacterium HT1-32]|nr:tripartite tricarboxylate transporter substrate binding protein [Alphaproteobacteria bacterium HT1-32]